uniref:Orf 06101 protein n=1 Tax=Saccharomyces cerevisiae TaxID=4932 RepID=E9PA90_YEASX|nr:orf 06101 [Saccharomyces cerevisiae]
MLSVRRFSSSLAFSISLARSSGPFNSLFELVLGFIMVTGCSSSIQDKLSSSSTNLTISILSVIFDFLALVDLGSLILRFLIFKGLKSPPSSSDILFALSKFTLTFPVGGFADIVFGAFITPCSAPMIRCVVVIECFSPSSSSSISKLDTFKIFFFCLLSLFICRNRSFSLSAFSSAAFTFSNTSVESVSSKILLSFKVRIVSFFGLSASILYDT